MGWSLGCLLGLGNCGSMCRGGVEEGTVPLLADFQGLAWPLPPFQSLCPLLICNWRPFSCCPGCGSQDGWVCICTGSFFHHPNPHWVYSQKLSGFLFSSLKPRAAWSGLGLGSLTHKVSPDFYPPHMDVGLPVLPPLLPHCLTAPTPRLCPSYPSG